MKEYCTHRNANLTFFVGSHSIEIFLKVSLYIKIFLYPVRPFTNH